MAKEVTRKFIISAGGSGIGRSRLLKEISEKIISIEEPVFQFESNSASELLKELQPRKFNHLSMSKPMILESEAQALKFAEYCIENEDTMVEKMRIQSMEYNTTPTELSSKKLKKLWNEAKKHHKHPNEINELQQAYIEAKKEGR